MDSGRFDVLENARHPARFAVAEHVDIELDGALEELIDQGGLVDLELVGAPCDAHAPPAEDVVRANEYRVADPLGHGERLARGVPATPQRGARIPRLSSTRANFPDLRRHRSPAGGLRAGARLPAASPWASPSGVCPPSVTTTPTGCSSAQTSSARSIVTGSR